MKSNKPQDSSSKRLPLGKAVLWIVASSLVISGSSFLAFLYIRHLKEERRHDPKFQIVAIAQTSKDKSGLKTAYLAELLDLSIENPLNLYAFDLKEAKQKLLNSPVIKDVAITKIRPGTIWVDYALRKPIAFLGDYTNTAIDAEGVAFPFNPFFTPKTLPEVYLGIADESLLDPVKKEHYPWGSNLQGKRLAIAFSLLQLTARLFSSPSTFIASVDVSRAFSSSCGQCQIVVVLQERIEKIVQGQPKLCIYFRVLRLGSDNYRQQLENFVTLDAYLRQYESGLSNAVNDSALKDESTVIDLRISDLAFISTGRL